MNNLRRRSNDFRRLPPPPARNCRSRGSAERIWGESFSLVRRILENCQRISPANFSTNFSALFLQGFRPLQKIHAQNSRPKSSAFLSNFKFVGPKFFTPTFCLRGRPKVGGMDLTFGRVGLEGVVVFAFCQCRMNTLLEGSGVGRRSRIGPLQGEQLPGWSSHCSQGQGLADLRWRGTTVS